MGKTNMWLFNNNKKHTNVDMVKFSVWRHLYNIYLFMQRVPIVGGSLKQVLRHRKVFRTDGFSVLWFLRNMTVHFFDLLTS